MWMLIEKLKDWFCKYVKYLIIILAAFYYEFIKKISFLSHSVLYDTFYELLGRVI